MDKSVWRGVISSIEETAPLYDEVNEIISLRRASKARAYAAQKLMEDNPNLVLDSGVGPGSMSMILLQQHPDSGIVALDYSSQLLRSFNERTKNSFVPVLKNFLSDQTHSTPPCQHTRYVIRLISNKQSVSTRDLSRAKDAWRSLSWGSQTT